MTNTKTPKDPGVLEDREKYITAMDKLAFRQPLWLQLPVHEFWTIKDRMPSEGHLVHKYEDEMGASMVEIHVDLDDSFDSKVFVVAVPAAGL